MNFQERLFSLQEKITKACDKAGRKFSDIQLVAVSKGQETEAIFELYNAGQRNFGENRVHEALDKIALLPKDISWHFIGTLQQNKVRKVVGAFSLIHSVESVELAAKIDTVSREMGIKSDILIQVNTSKEMTKHGLSEEQLIREFHEYLQLENIRVLGLMTMAPKFLTQSEDEFLVARLAFSDLRKLKDKLITLYPEIKTYFKELSMGMSQDFELAIHEGATIIRIGSLLFL